MVQKIITSISEHDSLNWIEIVREIRFGGYSYVHNRDTFKSVVAGLARLTYAGTISEFVVTGLTDVNCGCKRVMLIQLIN